MNRSVLFVMGLIALSAGSGCGRASDAPELYTVTGTVTFDGAPVDEGRILFRATEGDQKAYSAEITAGSYEVEVEPGLMRVEITATRLIPGKFDESNPGEKVPVGEMYIPATYNSESSLTADITADESTVDFTLTADGAR